MRRIEIDLPLRAGVRFAAEGHREAAAEASRDLPEPDGATGRRVKVGTVLSVRLNEEEFAALTELAHAKHIPTSTMARSLILQAMRGDAALGSTVHDAVVTALREVLPKDLLAG